MKASGFRGWMCAAAALVAGGFLSSCTIAPRTYQEYNARQAESNNMALLGHVDLHARSAYHPEIKQQGNRWIAYVGHHGGPAKVNPLNGRTEFNGTSIIDVTDPRAPKTLFHIPGQEGGTESGGAQMVRICAGKDLPKGDKSKFYLLRSFGNSAHEVWDVTNPESPSIVSTPVRGLRDTHKNWWECDTGIAYLVSGPKGWRSRRILQVFDLSDPAKPVHIRDFGLPGQQPGATGTVPTELHGAISTGRAGNRVYFGYGTNKGGILQIREVIALPSSANLKPRPIAHVLSKSIIALNVFSVALWTVGVFASLYAGYLDPTVRVTSSNLSAVINGVATIMMFIIVDPQVSVMTDDVIEVRITEPEFRKAIVWLVGSRLAGTILAQLLLVPSAQLVVHVAKWW